MRRRVFLALSGTSGLAACTSGPGPQAFRGAGGPGGEVAILLPLSGSHADLAQPLQQAAELAFGAPTLVAHDTAGTPQGAATAAHNAVAGGAKLILGPLTAPEVVGAKAVTRSAQVPMLAFSNDPTIAERGCWPLGITPDEQVRRLVDASQQAGRMRFAALLPSSAFGRALGEALNRATSDAGLATPTIRFHGGGTAAIAAGIRSVSAYDARWGPIKKEIELASTEGTPEARRKANRLRQASPGPPPFDVLLLGDTGESLGEMPMLLTYYFVGPPGVHFVGPALWADPRSGSHAFPGAWYAAPDPAARASFVAAFSSRFGAAPPSLADIAYDAASIARVVGPEGYSLESITRPAGFIGVSGPLRLLPDGRVRRGLALFQVERGGPQLIQPAPGSVSA